MRTHDAVGAGGPALVNRHSAARAFWEKRPSRTCVMTQTVPGPAQRIDRALFRHSVYQAIVN
jgi:hypothetical protein